LKSLEGQKVKERAGKR